MIPALGRQRQVDFQVRGQPGLQSEFEDSQGYTEKPCLEKRERERERENMNQEEREEKSAIVLRFTDYSNLNFA